MKNHKFWLAVIVFLLAWSFYEMYPPTSRNLIEVFQQQADQSRVDNTFKGIVASAEKMEKDNPDPHKTFGYLLEASGTNDLKKYFPFVDVQGQENPNYVILNNIQRKALGKIKLGLDLQGGSQFMVSLDTKRVADTNAPKSSIADAEERKRMVSQAAEVLRKRVDKLGVAEPIIQPAGPNHILIQLPGLSQAQTDEAKKNIQKAAFLEFRLVHPQSDQLIKEGVTEPGYEVLQEKRKDANGNVTLHPYLVQKRLANGLTGSFIKRAYPSRDPISNSPEIQFEFNSDGADRFATVTRENVGRQLAIVLDGELYSAPVIQGAIPGGRGVITGSFDIAEAISLANVLENPLEAPVHIEETRQVDPTLGKDTITSGVYSAFIGTLLVALFMWVYYHRCGVIANIAMICNLIILLGVMCSVGTTLTLPGIAGIVLTVGMAVDANVLIYERLREELATGKSMRGAISAAYSRAFGTIFDSHTTTLISAIILIYMGTGSVKGFGVTLTIGVALSLFTALVVTRLIFDGLLAKGWLNKIGMLHIIKNPHWDFMKWAKVAFISSWVIIAIGIGCGAYRELGTTHGWKTKSIMGIDFAGGDAVTLSFKQNQKIDVDKLRDSVSKFGESQIQYQKGEQQEMLEIVTPFGKGESAANALVKDFPNADFKIIGQSQVGPTVGLEIQKTAILATLVSLFGILLYVALRYEFSFSVGAVLAILHDVLMTLGIFFLWGGQLSAPVVAAVLTIIGFSNNDTIVIFDRIREDLKMGVKGTFREVMNKALNQTLSRTIITSGTVFLSALALFLFGGAGLHDFAFLFLVGVVSGTYSSIYIASALVLWWHKGERPNIGASQVTVENAPSARAQV